jgi:hypothetical protein
MRTHRTFGPTDRTLNLAYIMILYSPQRTAVLEKKKIWLEEMKENKIYISDRNLDDF